MSEEQKDLIRASIAESPGQTPIRIQVLQLSHYEKAGADYAGRIQEVLVANEHAEFSHGLSLRCDWLS